MKKVRVRYAPSPTGHLHIGNARTALFNYLFAKHYEGDFVLRIEDTDIERNVEGGEESQLYYMHWLGIDPDESPKNPGAYGPYRQMERLDIYRKHTDWLIEKGYAYKCYCTSEELDEDYQKQVEAGFAATRYNRKCLHLNKEQRQLNEQSDLPYTVRIRVPDNDTYTFHDMIRGDVTFEAKDIGDWVLVKANGIPTYNYAVVIDDHLMAITHVFRGEEHLSNTPKQLMLYRMFGWEEPQFAHMTLIVNEQRKKLSKRDNSIMQYMSQYKDLGYLPQAMFNFMALLGWSPEGEQEIYSPQELIKVFDEKRLSKSPSMFDKQKLTWVNNRYIKEMPLTDVVALCKPFLEQEFDLSNRSAEWIDKLVGLFHDQLSYGHQITELARQFFIGPEVLEEDAKEALAWETTPVIAKAFLEHLPQEWTVDNLKLTMDAVKNETKIKGKPLFMGLRASTTGQCHGPDLMSTIFLLGKDEVSKRLGQI
ncbi:MAG: glutamate--tRNA ligase [Erysipelotrichaceae bacterium]|nr:glutamate--tRNA ligase [Erysipelotrichaceae bacterium]